MKKFMLTIAALSTFTTLARADQVFDEHWRNARVPTDTAARRFVNRCLIGDEQILARIFPSVDKPGRLIVQYPELYDNRAAVCATLPPDCDDRCRNQ